MIKDVECPYCGEWQEINHDGGYGYSEDEVYQQGCNCCKKIFTYTTSISFIYESGKAPCLNDGKHKWEQYEIVAKKYTKMICVYCDERRDLTEGEWKDILK